MPFLRRPSLRETVLVTLLLGVAVFLGWRWLTGSAVLLPSADTRPQKQEPLTPVERIDLARLEKRSEVREAGRRNLFEYGVTRAPEPPPPTVIVPTPRPASAPATDAAAGTAAIPSLPPLNVRYIGSVENAAGAKVAVLVTDRQEVLTGQPGQVIANRYRVARIGLESVDLEDVSTGQSRRIPLRGGT
jgi:hypothetical protein